MGVLIGAMSPAGTLCPGLTPTDTPVLVRSALALISTAGSRTTSRSKGPVQGTAAAGLYQQPVAARV